MNNELLLTLFYFFVSFSAAKLMFSKKFVKVGNFCSGSFCDRAFNAKDFVKMHTTEEAGESLT
ncbi:hypothetical protein [Gloeocapsopsis dulcis]|uniref:hypothetical protein n=1 Tax=Gloeocapsopsis dulcis TaxID=2859516 RepID=UPI00101AE463|nr:hypothetical protein [Gloeocapsopsis dulcis]